MSGRAAASLALLLRRESKADRTLAIHECRQPSAPSTSGPLPQKAGDQSSSALIFSVLMSPTGTSRCGMRRIPTLGVCVSAAGLGLAFLLVGRTPSPAAPPVVQLASDPSSVAGPLAWWRFNEGTGSNVHDATGHGYNGAIHGAARWVEAPSGKALAFDGSSFVEVPFQRLGGLKDP